MATQMETTDTYVIVQAGGTLCALPLGSVAETLRASHLDLSTAQDERAGTALVRGHHLPVFHLATALGIRTDESSNRLVRVRLADKSGNAAANTEACLLVHAVEGLRDFDSAQLGRLPIVSSIHAGLADLLTRSGSIPADLDQRQP